jgi:RES domain-containing protein
LQIDRAISWSPNQVIVYRWLPSSAKYLPNSPWPSVNRFGRGDYPTLYLSGSAIAAMSEFFRLHAEFLELQEDLAIRLFEMELSTFGNVVDLTESAGQVAIGISEERLSSSEPSVEVRFAECWEVGEWAVSEGFVGIAYPCAATSRPNEWNIVLFGAESTESWQLENVHLIGMPIVSPEDVRTL